jgi:hypothetical protein
LVKIKTKIKNITMNNKKIEKVINYLNVKINKNEIEAEKSLKEKRLGLNFFIESNLATLKDIKEFINNLK